MSWRAYASRDSPPSHTLLDQNLDPRVAHFSAIPDENGIMLADKYDGHYLKNSSKTGDGIFRIMKLLSRSLAQNSKPNDDIHKERTVQLEIPKSQSCCQNA